MSIEVAQERIRLWRHEPDTMVRQLFSVEPDAWQVDLLRAFASTAKEHQRIACQSCAGTGKTAGLAWCGINFLLCYAERGEHPKGAALSVTQDNLYANLWPELTKWIGRSELLSAAFEVTASRVMARGETPNGTKLRDTWFLDARSFPKTANPDEQGRTLSGLHGKFVLILIDESGDIAPSVIRTAEQARSKAAFAKIVMAGNPTSPDGCLHEAATTLAHLWYLIRITGDPDDPKRSPRVDAKWAREQIATYGRDNPWVMAYILGLFPPAGLNTLLGADEVRTAMDRHIAKEVYAWVGKRIGVDVALGGDDLTVLFPRQGLAAFQPEEMRTRRPSEIAARVIAAKNTWAGKAGHKVVAYVDDTGGYGAGVIDALMQANQEPVGVQYAGKPTDPRYLNKRAEIWWRMAEWVKRGGALPNHPRLARELTTVRYTLHKGKLQIEEKDQLKKRLGFSPDYADALCNTFSNEDAPIEYELPTVEGLAARAAAMHQEEAKGDYDPYSKARW